MVPVLPLIFDPLLPLPKMTGNLDREQCFCVCGNGRPTRNVRLWAKLGLAALALQTLLAAVSIVVNLVSGGEK